MEESMQTPIKITTALDEFVNVFNTMIDKEIDFLLYLKEEDSS